MKGEHDEILTFYPECRDTDGESKYNDDNENQQEHKTATHRPFLSRQRQLALRLVKTPPGDAIVPGERCAVALATLARRHHESAGGNL